MAAPTSRDTHTPPIVVYSSPPSPQPTSETPSDALQWPSPASARGAQLSPAMAAVKRINGPRGRRFRRGGPLARALSAPAVASLSTTSQNTTTNSSQGGTSTEDSFDGVMRLDPATESRQPLGDGAMATTTTTMAPAITAATPVTTSLAAPAAVVHKETEVNVVVRATSTAASTVLGPLGPYSRLLSNSNKPSENSNLAMDNTDSSRKSVNSKEDRGTTASLVPPALSFIAPTMADMAAQAKRVRWFSPPATSSASISSQSPVRGRWLAWSPAAEGGKDLMRLWTTLRGDASVHQKLVGCNVLLGPASEWLDWCSRNSNRLSVDWTRLLPCISQPVVGGKVIWVFCSRSEADRVGQLLRHCCPSNHVHLYFICGQPEIVVAQA